MICPHRKNRSKAPTQDGRALRRYRRRWKVERTFAWLGNFRRLVVRYERHPPHFSSAVYNSTGLHQICPIWVSPRLAFLSPLIKLRVYQQA